MWEGGNCHIPRLSMRNERDYEEQQEQRRRGRQGEEKQRQKPFRASADGQQPSKTFSRRTHSMTALRTRREEQRAPSDARLARKTRPHVRRQRSHGSSASRIFQIFHASLAEKRSPHRALDLNSPTTTMSSTLHPEVLWAQRSSETDETKVRRRGHPRPAIEGA